MKLAIIDIGSNSVRLAIFADGNIIYRDKITSRLGEGISLFNRLQDGAVSRTLDAISAFYEKSIEHGVLKSDILPFATAAVRQAENGSDFIDAVWNKFGVKIDLLSEDSECLVAVYGALPNGNGAVLDVGGASSELVVANGGEIIYSKSLDEGAVKLTDKFTGDFDGLTKYLETKVLQYSAPMLSSLTAIGGTAGTLSFVLSGDKTYDKDRNHGRFVPITDLYAYLLKIKDLSSDEIASKYNVEKQRAQTIFCGGVLIYEILKYLNLDGYTLSESDNLEGYYLLKTKGDGYEEK